MSGMCVRKMCIHGFDLFCMLIAFDVEWKR